MAGVFKGAGGAPSAAITPDYTGLQIQTAVNALPIPIVWGVSRLAPNVIWYNGFLAVQVAGGGGGGGAKGGVFGGGGGGGGNANGYDYYADIIMALCEGPIGGISRIWRGQSLYTLPSLGLSLALGGSPQAIWNYLATTYPSQALAYQGTAYVFAEKYDLTDAATIDNHNMEVLGFFSGTGVNAVDADPALVINDFLSNQQYGAVSPTGTPINVDLSTLFGAGGDASLQTYCRAVGLALSPALTNQETASSILGRWLDLVNCAAVYSAGRLRFIPYGDSATLAGTVTPTTQEVEVPPLSASATLVSLIALAQSAGPAYASLVAQLQAQLAAGAGGTTLAITVAPPSGFVIDSGVTYSVSGAPLSYIGANCPLAAGTYGMGPPGTYLFYLADAQAEVTIAYSYSAAASYVPDVTPVYDLDDDDYIVEDGQDPVQAARTDPYKASNVWRLEVALRNNAYNLTPIEARDQNAIQRFGMRIASTVTAHEICDQNVAAVSAQLMLQRAVYVRNTFKVRLSWEYCLLDPMDLVTLTEGLIAAGGIPGSLFKQPARITDIEEDDNGYLEFTFEEFPQGAATATTYPTSVPVNNPVNREVAPDPVNAPIFYTPPATVNSSVQNSTAPSGATVSDTYLWIALSGGAAGVADPNWGGAIVNVSLDNRTFAPIGTALGAAKMGALTANLGTSSMVPDTTDTLAVNLAESGGALPASVSTTDAQTGANTLCLVDSELMSFHTAALTGANAYACTGLFRGLYGTTQATHSIGAPFALLDASIFKLLLPAQYVGKTLIFKFQSINVFGGAPQPISTCTEYTYSPPGVPTDHPVARACAIDGATVDLGLAHNAVGPTTDDFGANVAMTIELYVDLLG